MTVNNLLHAKPNLLRPFLWLLLLSGISGQAQELKKADDLVNAIGVNVHFGYTDTPYHQRYEEVRDLLGELGVRFIRDRIDDAPWRRKIDWWDLYGIQMAAFLDARDYVGQGNNPDLNQVPGLMEIARNDYGSNRLVAIMGLNEWDQSRSSKGNEKPREVWVDEWRLQQQIVYDAVKTDEELASLPVVMSPLAHSNNIQFLGDISSMVDIGNDHPYPGIRGLPSQESGDGVHPQKIEAIVEDIRDAAGNVPIWFTETGYSQTYSSTIGTAGDVTSRARAKYAPRIIANHFRNPDIEKTFIYELVSINAATPWGLARHDLAKSAAFYTLKNLITLCKEAAWNATTKKWSRPPRYTLRDLDYSLEGNLENVERLLLQKSDGTYLLLLWQEVLSYDPDQQANIKHALRNLKFTLNDRTASSVNIYRLFNEANPAAPLSPIQTYSQTTQVAVGVPDDIVALEIKLEPSSSAVLPGTYQLLARHSGKALDVQGKSAAQKANVQQWQNVGGDNQQWQITPAGNGYYTLKAKHSDLALAVDLDPATDGEKQDPTANGVNIFQYGTSEQDDRLWKIEPVGQGYYKLTNKYSGKVLDVSRVSQNNGASVHQWTYVGGANQQWQLEAVNASGRVADTSSKLEINASLLEPTLRIYPNPAHAQLTVEATDSQDYQVTIYDLSGRRMMQHDHLSGQTQVDISHLRPGVYILKMRDREQREGRQRIIVE